MMPQVLPQVLGDQEKVETYHREEVIFMEVVVICLVEKEICNQEEAILMGMMEVPLGEALLGEEEILTILMTVMMEIVVQVAVIQQEEKSIGIENRKGTG